MTVFHRVSGSSGICACATVSAGMTSSWRSLFKFILAHATESTYRLEFDQLGEYVLGERREFVLNLHMAEFSHNVAHARRMTCTHTIAHDEGEVSSAIGCVDMMVGR